MKLGHAFFTTVFLAGYAMAQEDPFAALPDCAVSCLEESLGVSTCDPTDIGCLCIDQGFNGAMQGCLGLNCTIKDTLTTTNATIAACGGGIQDASPTIIGIAASFGTFALMLVILRVVERTLIRKVGLHWDDYLIIVAAAAASILNYLAIPMAKLGFGRDMWTIEFEDISQSLLLLYVMQVHYMFSELCAQLALLVFYLRVFPKSSRQVHIGSWILIAFVTAFGIANTTIIIFQCTPVPFFWDGWMGEMEGKCVNMNIYSWIRAALEITLGVAIMALPLPSLIKLQVSKKKKLQTIGMFAMGFVITVVSCLRLQSLVQYSATQNPTYDNSPAVYWSVLECDMFIICACLPSVRSIAVKMFPAVFGGSTVGSKTASGVQQGSNRNYASSQQLSSLSKQKPNNIIRRTDIHVYQEMSASDEELVAGTNHTWAEPHSQALMMNPVGPTHKHES